MRKNTIALITTFFALCMPLGCNAVPVPPVEEPDQEPDQVPGQEQEKPEEPEQPKEPVLKLEWVGYMDGYNTISAPAVADDGSSYGT